MITITFLAAFAIMIASLSGVIFMWASAGKWLQRNTRYLITFSAGVFIIVSYDLFNESLELSEGNILLVVIGAFVGAIVLELASWLIPTTHHHHGTEGDHTHTRTDARRVLLGDAIHNIADGILLVPSFLIDIRLGVATAAAIFLHEVVQEISEFFVLREAGYSNARALTLNFLVSATVLIGVVIGTSASNVSSLLPGLITFAAGSFLYVVFRDLLPSTMRAISRNKDAGKHLIAGVLGIVVMFGVSLTTPHSHENDNLPETPAEELLD